MVERGVTPSAKPLYDRWRVRQSARREGVSLSFLSPDSLTTAERDKIIIIMATTNTGNSDGPVLTKHLLEMDNKKVLNILEKMTTGQLRRNENRNNPNFVGLDDTLQPFEETAIAQLCHKMVPDSENLGMTKSEMQELIGGSAWGKSRGTASRVSQLQRQPQPQWQPQQQPIAAASGPQQQEEAQQQQLEVDPRVDQRIKRMRECLLIRTPTNTQSPCTVDSSFPLFNVSNKRTCKSIDGLSMMDASRQITVDVKDTPITEDY